MGVPVLSWLMNGVPTEYSNTSNPAAVVPDTLELQALSGRTVIEWMWSLNNEPMAMPSAVASETASALAVSE